MATWQQFADAQPEMASLGQRVLSKYGLAYLGTIRRDGGPRVHPVSPAIVAGGVYIGLIPHTPKRRDLDRDGRCVLHALPGPNDAEIYLTGIARPIGPEEVEELLRLAPPNVRLARDTAIYELDIARVNCTTFVNPGAGERPVATRSRWVAPA